MCERLFKTDPVSSLCSVWTDTFTDIIGFFRGYQMQAVMEESSLGMYFLINLNTHLDFTQLVDYWLQAVLTDCLSVNMCDTHQSYYKTNEMLWSATSFDPET